MKVCILGATGNTGRRLVSQALDRGHEVTAVVRRGGNSVELRHDNLALKSVDYADDDELQDAMNGQDAVVNAAGYLSDPSFSTVVGKVIQAADAALGPGGRFWMFAGAALLDVPGTSIMTMDLPRIPPVYRAHRANYDVVRRTRLDWSVLCPGPMIASPDGQATEGLKLSREIWPLPRPAYTKFLFRIALSLAFKNSLPRLTVYYEDAAKVVLDNLDKNGHFKRSRVGIALPKGMQRHKENYSTAPAPASADRRV